MEIIPALSIQDGKCIRLTQGDYDRPKAYNYTPLDVAESVRDHGFQRLHVADLDGARRGSVAHQDTLQMIVAYTGLEVDYSGGVRTDGDIRRCFEHGAKAINSASTAVLNPELFTSWIISYGRQKLILAADSANGYVATRGWQKPTRTHVMDLIQYYYDRSILYVKATDIARDGTLEGPNFDLYREIRHRFPDLRLIASGGVRSLQDLDELQNIGCHAVIVGKALYERKLTLKDLENFAVSQAR